MEINNHINEEQWDNLLIPPESGAQHLAECPDCRQEHAHLQNAILALSGWVRSAEEQPEIFWERQRLAIRARINQNPLWRRNSTRLVWITAFGLILLASLILRTGSRMPVGSSAINPDRELLVQVEQALDGDVPQALEPASLIANEINQSAHLQSNSTSSKEKSEHEN